MLKIVHVTEEPRGVECYGKCAVVQNRCSGIVLNEVCLSPSRLYPVQEVQRVRLQSLRTVQSEVGEGGSKRELCSTLENLFERYLMQLFSSLVTKNVLLK